MTCLHQKAPAMAALESGAPLRFQPFSSTVDVSFWQELGARKLHSWKLDARPRQIVGFYSTAPHARLPSTLAVRAESFPKDSTDVAG